MESAVKGKLVIVPDDKDKAAQVKLLDAAGNKHVFI